MINQYFGENCKERGYHLYNNPLISKKTNLGSEE